MHLLQSLFVYAVKRPVEISMNCLLIGVLLPSLDRDVNEQWIQFDAASLSSRVLTGNHRRSTTAETIEYNPTVTGAITNRIGDKRHWFNRGMHLQFF